MTRLFPTIQATTTSVDGLVGAALPLFIAQSAQAHAGATLVIAPSSAVAQQLVTDVAALCSADYPILEFPDWETLAYDPFSPHRDIISARIQTLYHLPHMSRGLLVLPISTLMQRLAPPSFVVGHALIVEKGQLIAREQLIEQLIDAGYRRVEQVMEHGEFAVRGAILDLFPMAQSCAYRLDFFDDEVDDIKSFDIETQRSADTHQSIRLLPAHEFPTDDEAIKRFKRRYREGFDEHASQTAFYRDISNGLLPSGVEYYQPLFHEKMATLFDYLPATSLVFTLEGKQSAIERHWDDILARFETLRHDRQRPILAPAQLFLDPDETALGLRTLRGVQLNVAPCAGSLRESPMLPMQTRSEEPLGALKAFLSDYSGRVLFTAASAGRREALLRLLRENAIDVHSDESLGAFLRAEHRLGLTILPMEQGAIFDEADFALISEPQLLGERSKQRRRRCGSRRAADAIISNLSDLREGAPVVHTQHGVGRYLGLTNLDIGGVTTEFLALEYAGDAKLYVPVASLHLISRYTGADEEHAPLHKLGSDQWSKARRKAAERVRDVAAELLEVHARRKARPGQALALEPKTYQAFAQAFPFEETPDQEAAIDAVVEDLTQPRSMDRIVCGDVGFGKTEVAMRAAFVAVEAGQQVAVLVPTTLLAQQHHQNFLDRFADWPFQIESVSRFRTKKQQSSVLEAVADGRVDIIIGTHRLLQKDVKWARLGLVIIDEEHRFGVRHKEHFKSLRSEVDILTLTATPIPRTLNMSLAGLRDLSIIATPPQARHAIKTFTSEWNDALIREACQRELARGGQIYFLHNEVQSIERIAGTLRALLPEVKIEVAHGQMRESELERIMLDFCHQRFNILVATTIIESGIDVPSANTIIIHRADKLGLAQLHQLRGRVGRSHHRAYAYLLIPPRKLLTADAQKRLSALEALEELGIGFSLATQDLEIRGAGELLGDDQTGQIQEIGFTLYSELLDRAVQALKAGRIPELDQDNAPTEVDLHLPALLPDDYVVDVHSRLVLYKRMSNAQDAAELREIAVELIDRFGLLPEPAKTLIGIHELKLQAQNLGIQKFDLGPRGGRINFSDSVELDPGKLIQLIQKQTPALKFSGPTAIAMNIETGTSAERLNFSEKLLKELEQTR